MIILNYQLKEFIFEKYEWRIHLQYKEAACENLFSASGGGQGVESTNGMDKIKNTKLLNDSFILV